METICVQKRDRAAKAKQLRREGITPANVFGKSLEKSELIQLKTEEAERLFREKREGSKLKLDIEGEKIPVQIKEISMDYLKKEILHMDFQALTKGEKVNSLIHILLSNEDKVSGQLEKMMLEIPYSSLAEDMIDTITIDLDGMKTGTIMLVRDIPELMNDKIELHVDPEEIVLRISERKHYVEEAEE